MSGPTSTVMGKVRKTNPDQVVTIHLLKGNKKEKGSNLEDKLSSLFPLTSTEEDGTTDLSL